MKRCRVFCSCAVVALAGCGCNLTDRAVCISGKVSAGESWIQYASFREMEIGIGAWARSYAGVTENVRMCTAGGTFSAQVIPAMYFGERAWRACQDLGSNAPALEYWTVDEPCVAIEDVPEPFAALRLHGDFRIGASANSRRLRSFEWDNGRLRAPGIMADIVSRFPSLRQIDMVLYSPPSEGETGENSFANEIIDLAPLMCLKSLEHFDLSLPTLVSNADALLRAGRPLEARVSASMQDTKHLHDYLMARGWLGADGSPVDRQLAKKAYVAADPGRATHAVVVDGFDEMVVEGLHDFKGSKPSASVRLLEIDCKSAEQESFQRMFDDLPSILPNVEWVIVRARFAERSSFNIASLCRFRSLVFIGVEIENGVVLNMDVCRQLSGLAACDFCFRLHR